MITVSRDVNLKNRTVTLVYKITDDFGPSAVKHEGRPAEQIADTALFNSNVNVIQILTSLGYEMVGHRGYPYNSTVWARPPQPDDIPT